MIGVEEQPTLVRVLNAYFIALCNQTIQDVLRRRLCVQCRIDYDLNAGNLEEIEVLLGRVSVVAGYQEKACVTIGFRLEIPSQGTGLAV